MSKDAALRWLFRKLLDYMSGSGVTEEDAAVMRQIKMRWIDK